MITFMSGLPFVFIWFRYALKRQPFSCRAKRYEDDSAKGRRGKIVSKQQREEELYVSKAKLRCEKAPTFVVVDLRSLNQLENKFGAFHSVANEDAYI